ncbi:MAG: hypothetical protein HY082_02725, partial [Gammaproteobacteria bacterium]|nr:hypothetical protein [Gammaproteobacteria bacterium]
MKLNVIVDERALAVDVPTHMLHEAEDFYRTMDRDMDHGWQMGPEFIENPDKVQRCQIAANKLLTSLSAANETMITLMAGYILKRLPGVTGVRIDTGGEMLHTEIVYEKPASTAPIAAPAPAASRAQKLGKFEAMEQAGKDVTKVYQVGKSYRFAVRDLKTGEWLESGPMETGQEAYEKRMQAYKRRLD